MTDNVRPFSSVSRFDEPLFRNQELQKELASKGYVVTSCLKEDKINWLLNEFQQIRPVVPTGYNASFWPSGRCEDPGIRNTARSIIEGVVPDVLDTFFVEGSVVFDGGTFLVKPHGEATALNPHQDSSHVDESRSFSLYAWIPLVDTTADNGALHILPGSHLFGNRHRSLNVPWSFRGLENELAKHMIPLEMKAGDVCFFEGATIHHSPPNLTDEIRVALNYFIRPSSQQFLHHYIDEQTPDGMVEVYRVSIDFFYNEDFESRPPKKHFIRHEPLSQLSLDADSLKELINRCKPV